MRPRLEVAAVRGVALWLAAATAFAQSGGSATRYPEMAAAEQYRMPRAEEIQLARSAAPPSISDSAEIWVLDRDGYTQVAKGSNGFSCLVERGWSAGLEDPDFWNPRLRAPICFNAAAARYLVPLLNLRTRAVFETRSKDELAKRVRDAQAKGELPALGEGAMCFMMSKSGYLSDQGGHWHPHLMFFEPRTGPAAWGSNLTGSPVLGFTDALDGVTTFLVPVQHWSDGTAVTAAAH
jgi:hypothetical protein